MRQEEDRPGGLWTCVDIGRAAHLGGTKVEMLMGGEDAVVNGSVDAH